MTKRYLTNRPGRQTTIEYQDGLPLIVMTQDADPAISLAHELSRDAPARLMGSQNHYRHVAEVPSVLYHKWLAAYGQPKHNPKKWKQLLNDHENRHFRVWGGNV